jgi:hypothetical protein
VGIRPRLAVEGFAVARPGGINNCVKRAPITLVQPPLREYIGAKFGVVG